MSLYNMLFGQNQAAELLLAMLNLDKQSVGRFRDCYTNADGTKIIVYTRNGGGNREEYMPDFSKHPNYLRDYDDDFDCTFASIEFSVPEPFIEAVKKISDATDTRTGAEKFAAMMEDLKANKDTAQTARAVQVGERIFGTMKSDVKETKVSTPDGSVTVKKL